jgi:hypothetical protein
MNFLPSQHGFKFSNNDIPPIPIKFGGVALPFKASGGLCGGMTWTVLDYWIAKKKVPETMELDYLWKRQVDSLQNGLGILAYYWHQVGWSDKPLYQEARKLARLLRNRPITLGIIYQHSINPIHLVEAHQVLAYACEDKSFKVYDPNRPGDDNCYLSPYEDTWWLDDNQVAEFFITAYIQYEL